MIAEARIVFLTLVASSCWNLVFWVYYFSELHHAFVTTFVLLPLQAYLLYKTRYLIQVSAIFLCLYLKIICDRKATNLQLLK